jgi:dTDP-glucose pyrophosphorylase
MADTLAGCVVAEDGTIRDAMRAVDRGAAGIALATDRDGRLAGIVTDGDLRRALLGGSTMDDPLAQILNRQFVSLRPGQGRAEVLELMQARRISAIPIVDDGLRPVGLHLLHAFLDVAPRPNWAVIMAGGRGVRLRPLTDTVPKPMLKVAGRPILERIVLHLVGSGISRVFLAINYQGDVIEAHFGDGRTLGCSIEYLREEEPLGTAGALSLLPEPPSDTLVVLNGDLVTNVDIGGLLDFHASGRFDATIGTRRYVHSVPFGSVEADGDRVVALEEKPAISRLVNSGIYALEPHVAGGIPPGTPMTMPEVIDGVLAGGGRVGAFEVEGDWIDVGQRDQLAAAREGT